MAPRNRRIIDLDQMTTNMSILRGAISQSAKMIAVVKADAYGHGAIPSARAAIRGGADILAVASVQEGAELRNGGIAEPILVLGPVTAGDVYEGVAAHLIQTVCSPEMVELCAKAAAALEQPAEVHLKIDSGMGRVGVRTEEERDRVLHSLKEAKGVRLTGAFTHFSDADGDDDGAAYTVEQFHRFRELSAVLSKQVLLHCANSAAIHRMPDTALDMVRAGISLYGYPPVKTELDLKPCMRWIAKVNYVKDVPAGTFISYGRTYRTDGPERIATVTCGYADGYPRCAGGKAEVLIRGHRVPIVGRICMDQMMADITGLEDICPEDEVVLMGQDGGDRITADDIALWSNTISYEILLSAGRRVERCYLSKEN